MLSAAALSSYAYVAPAAPAVKAPAMIRMEEGNAVAQFEGPAPTAGLESLAAEQNPILGFWDPLGFTSIEFSGETLEASNAWLRHAEIKHGRVAMAGFVGYIIHENGIHWPWALFNGCDYSTFDSLSAPATWDALPEASKYQIVLFVGFLELWGESSYNLAQDGEKHYMRGGKPGYFPTFDEMVHPVPLNLWDPFGFTKKMDAEKKAKRLNMEVNNGRLAMIGLFGFLAEACVPGSVPGLAPFLKHYDGNVMIPFAVEGTFGPMFPFSPVAMDAL